MRSIGPQAFGIDFYNEQIRLRLPLEIHNMIKVWLSKIQFSWSDLPVPSQKVSIPTLEIINQLNSPRELGELIPWAIVTVPLLNSLRSRISRKLGISTRAGVGEKVSGGLVRVEPADSE